MTRCHPTFPCSKCNIGNPQSLGQLPLSFHRQVLSLIMAPELLSDANLPVTSKLFNADTIERAKRCVESRPESVGRAAGCWDRRW